MIFFSNPAFQNLSDQKMEFLMNFMNQKKPAAPKEMMALLMAFLNRARGEGIRFSPDETSLLVEYLKQSMSPADRRKADFLLSMFKSRS